MTDLGFNRLNSCPHSQLPPKPGQTVGMKQSMVLVKGSNPGLSFTNRSSKNLGNSGNRKNFMTQSFVQKDSTDIQSFMKEVREKLSSMTRTLSQHDREINDFRQRSNNTSFFSSNDSFFKNESFNNQLIRSVRKEFEQESFKLKNNMYAEIDSLKAQLRNQCIKKPELDYLFGKFQANITELVQNNNLGKELHDLKFKLKTQTENIRTYFNQELNSRLKQIQTSTSNNLLQLTDYIDKVKNAVKNIKQDLKPSFFTSNQKCYSPKLVKYKEILQKLPSSSYDKIGQPDTISETIYYLDKDGYLLDSSFYYLVDKNNMQIRLDQVQIDILNTHDMLR